MLDEGGVRCCTILYFFIPDTSMSRYNNLWVDNRSIQILDSGLTEVREEAWSAVSLLARMDDKMDYAQNAIYQFS